MGQVSMGFSVAGLTIGFMTYIYLRVDNHNFKSFIPVH